MASKDEISSMSDEIFDHRCSMCQEKGENVEASIFCTDCQDYYCATCEDLIHRAPALRNHEIINKDDVEQGEKSCRVPTSRCKRHGYKIIDMYCQDHDEVGCATCMIVKHKSCDVFDVPEYVKTNSNTHLEFVQAMRDTETQFKEFLDKFQHVQEQILLSKDEVIDQINIMRDKLEDVIKKKAEVAIKKVEEEFNKLNTEFADKKITLKDEIEKINKINKNVEAFAYNASQSFVLSKLNKDRFPEAELVKDEMKQVAFDHQFVFVPCPEYDTILSNTETSLGDIKITPFKYSLSETGNVDIEAIKAKHHLYDSCQSSNGSIFFTDCENNMLIRVCDTTMVVVERIKLRTTPYGVCRVSDNEIAVCIGKSIEIFNTENRLKFTRFININHISSGLSYHNGMLYVADSCIVYKYSMDGLLLKEYKANTKENTVFSDIANIVVNPLNNYVHITDWNNSVVTMDQEGSVVNIVKDIISGPWGVCVDKYGQVFVSGHYSNNIIQLSCHGKYINTVISERVYGPRMLCFDKIHGRLYVGNRWDNDITVFKAKLPLQ